MNQKGFSMILFLIVIALTIVVIGGIIYWTQNINKPTSTKPGSHLQQIQDPEKFAEQNQTDTLGQDCGGFAGKTCSVGLTCKLDGNYPDASGKCIKE